MSIRKGTRAGLSRSYKGLKQEREAEVKRKIDEMFITFL